MYFLFSKAGNFETSITRVPYNKLLTNLACSSRTGEYWPSVVFVWTSLRSVRTATTSGQYSPVRPSRSVSKRLIFSRQMESIHRRLLSLKHFSQHAQFRKLGNITRLFPSFSFRIFSHVTRLDQSRAGENM